MHHGIVTNSIESYKVGTWIREKFIGLDFVDTFKFKEDDTSHLKIFDNGIDAIIMRGTGILSLGSPNAQKSSICYRILRKIYRKITRKNQLEILLENLNELLEILNRGGVIFAKNENIFSNFEMDKRIELLNSLAGKISDKCEMTYRIEEKKYSNPGWELYNITILCKKK